MIKYIIMSRRVSMINDALQEAPVLHTEVYIEEEEGEFMVRRAYVIGKTVGIWFQHIFDNNQEYCRRAINRWKVYYEDRRVFDAGIIILQSSNQRFRSTKEIDGIKKLLLKVYEPTNDVFHNMQSNEIDRLCNDVSFHYVHDSKSLLFLQNDHGHYACILVSGTVDLYHLHSKDQEQFISQEFKTLLGNSISDNSILKLGSFLTTLPTGSIFGELAVVSETNKGRACAAVASPGALILCIPARTYKDVLRRYRACQDEIIRGANLLRQLPLLCHHSDAKINQLVYGAVFHTFPSRSIIFTAGTDIRSLFVVGKGEVKAFSPGQYAVNSRSLHLATAQLARGMVIGERELYKGFKTYEMTYVTITNCELLEIELHAYEHDLHAYHLQKTGLIHDALYREATLMKLHQSTQNNCKILIEALSDPNGQREPFFLRSSSPEKSVRKSTNRSRSVCGEGSGRPQSTLPPVTATRNQFLHSPIKPLFTKNSVCWEDKNSHDFRAHPSDDVSIASSADLCNSSITSQSYTSSSKAGVSDLRPVFQPPNTHKMFLSNELSDYASNTTADHSSIMSRSSRRSNKGRERAKPKTPADRREGDAQSKIRELFFLYSPASIVSC